MTTHERAIVKAERLCWGAINDACPELLKEGGVEEVLKFLAVVMHGEVVPASVILRLQEQAAGLQAAVA